MEELKRRAAERRAGTSAQDKVEQKRNEVGSYFSTFHETVVEVSGLVNRAKSMK